MPAGLAWVGYMGGNDWLRAGAYPEGLLPSRLRRVRGGGQVNRFFHFVVNYVARRYYTRETRGVALWRALRHAASAGRDSRCCR